LKVCGGIGLSLVQKGRLVRGGNGSAGEVEHVRVRIEEEDPLKNWSSLEPLEKLSSCPCDGTECVGRFATGASIIDQLVNYLDEDHLTPTERGRQIEAQPVQAVVRDVCHRAGSLLGQALVGPVLAFDPELIFVNSFPRIDALVEGFRSKLTKGTPTYLKAEDIITGTTDRETTAFGAAQLAIEETVIPRIEREAPKGEIVVERRNLPWCIRQEIPPKVKDVSSYADSYGKLQRRER
jgi:predicted NBD/HSP70 family sugar kinase